MKRQPRILAFAGSIRKESFNNKLLSIAAQAALQYGADVRVIDLSDYEMPLFDQDMEEEKGLPDNALRLKQLMIESDAFLIAAPEYNSSITPLLKNAIDWTSRKGSEDEPVLWAYQGKIAGIISASPGALGGLRGLYALRGVLENIGVTVIPDQFALGFAHEAFDEKGGLKDLQKQEAVDAIGRKLAEVSAKMGE